LGDRACAPDEVNGAVGTSVTWTSTNSILHTSTADGLGWDSGIVAPGAKFSLAFQTARTFRYHCTIHPGMVEMVVVR
jgi:plastocyanin